jgi:hypothetical protein
VFVASYKRLKGYDLGCCYFEFKAFNSLMFPISAGIVCNWLFKYRYVNWVRFPIDTTRAGNNNLLQEQCNYLCLHQY